MYSDWFNGIEILQGRWQHEEKVGYRYPSGLEKTLCEWDIYVPLVTKGTHKKHGNCSLSVVMVTRTSLAESNLSFCNIFEQNSHKCQTF